MYEGVEKIWVDFSRYFDKSYEKFNFAGINFREWHWKCDFAGINFRKRPKNHEVAKVYTCVIWYQ